MYDSKKRVGEQCIEAMHKVYPLTCLSDIIVGGEDLNVVLKMFKAYGKDLIWLVHENQKRNHSLIKTIKH